MPSNHRLSCSGNRGTLRTTWWWILSLCCAVITGCTGNYSTVILSKATRTSKGYNKWTHKQTTTFNLKTDISTGFVFLFLQFCGCHWLYFLNCISHKQTIYSYSYSLLQVSSFDGHCASHVEWLPAGLKSIPALPPEGDGRLWSPDTDGLKPGGSWTARHTWGHQGGAEECTSSRTGILTTYWHIHAHFALTYTSLRSKMACETTFSFNTLSSPVSVKSPRIAQRSRFSSRCACQPQKSSSWGPTQRACWRASGVPRQGNWNKETWGQEPGGAWRMPSRREVCWVTWGRCNVSSVACYIRCSLLTPTLPSWCTFR